MSLDKTDERIVAALIEDARASYATIGSLVGLSAPAVKRRVDRLLEAGAIRGFTARVDPAALGWTTEAYVELFCRALTSPADIRAAVRRYPEVVGACTVTGEADALLHIQAADVGHFEQVVERIAAEPFVRLREAVSVFHCPGNRSPRTRKTVLVQLHAGDDDVEEGNRHPNVRLVLAGWNSRATRTMANAI